MVENRHVRPDQEFKWDSGDLRSAVSLRKTELESVDLPDGIPDAV
jgi:hypothetical protein